MEHQVVAIILVGTLVMFLSSSSFAFAQLDIDDMEQNTWRKMTDEELEK